MPLIDKKPREMKDGSLVTTYTDTVGTSYVTYTLEKEQELIKIRNKGLKSIFYSVGSFVGIEVKPGEEKTTTANFTSFQVKSAEGIQQFEMWADEVGSTVVTAAQLADVANQQIIGKGGKKYKIVACVLRNTAGVWSIYEDAIHKSVNVASVSSDNDKITLNFDFVSTAIGGFACTPDETYVADGITFGASVGTQNALIYPKINKEVGGYIYYDGANWNIANAYGITSAVWSTDKLVITHSNLYQLAPNIYNANVNGRGGGHVPQLGGFGSNTVDVEFYDFAGTKITTPNTNMKIYFNRKAFGAVRPQDINQTGSNIWVMGIFEVA